MLGGRFRVKVPKKDFEEEKIYRKNLHYSLDRELEVLKRFAIPIEDTLNMKIINKNNK
jgi:hypothetical protein